VAQAESESRLLAALAAGDRQAAEVLVDRTYPMVFRLLCQLCHGDADRAADLAQETYRRAWTALPGFERRCAFGTWLCRIAHNSFLDSIRRRQEVADGPSGKADRLADDANDPVDVMIRDETTARLRRAVLALPDELRFAVAARFWADAAVREIAHLEHVSEVAIRKRLRRALRILAEALGAPGP
jgi:RNA polymerase sigma-70 factor (ECF subfamily)